MGSVWEASVTAIQDTTGPIALKLHAHQANSLTQSIAPVELTVQPAITPTSTLRVVRHVSLLAPNAWAHQLSVWDVPLSTELFSSFIVERVMQPVQLRPMPLLITLALLVIQSLPSVWTVVAHQLHALLVKVASTCHNLEPELVALPALPVILSKMSRIWSVYRLVPAT